MVVVGQRVQVGEYYAIVRYTGSVAGTEGDWLGVEWEESGRGKHDGSYKDVRYFTAQPLHGSFVRAHKLHPGASFSDVLKQRYDDVTGSGGEMSIINKDNSSTSVELVGLSDADVTRAATLTNLVMREESIVAVGDEAYIAEKCSNTINLDLSQNLLCDINHMLRIIHLMPCLEGIQLKANVLVKRDVCAVETPHLNLKKIYLAGAGLSWSELCRVAAHIPNITEVYISGSTLQLSNIPTTIFQSLTCLDMQYSDISDWSCLSDITSLPHLNTLILSNNTISHIKITPDQLTKLHSLSLDNNKIGDWESVASLRQLPLLTTLRLRHNPLITGPGLDMRLLVIAMLPTVHKLNGTPISANERLQADIFYLKYFGGEYHRGEEEFHTVHNRFKALIAEYGEPAKSGPKIASIKDQSIIVTITKPDGNQFEKKLLKTTLVKNLQVIVQRQCKILPRNQSLYWIDEEQQKIYLDDPTRDLAYFNMVENSIVYVEQ